MLVCIVTYPFVMLHCTIFVAFREIIIKLLKKKLVRIPCQRIHIS